VASEMQHEGPRPPAPSTGPRSPGVTAAAWSLVALVAAGFSVLLVWNLSRGYPGSAYLEAGVILGAICGLLLAGAVIGVHQAVTQQAPARRTLIIIAVVCLLLMQVALFAAGEHGNSQSPYQWASSMTEPAMATSQHLAT
jgi:hypothetical protein